MITGEKSRMDIGSVYGGSAPRSYCNIRRAMGHGGGGIENRPIRRVVQEDLRKI